MPAMMQKLPKRQFNDSVATLVAKNALREEALDYSQASIPGRWFRNRLTRHFRAIEEKKKADEERRRKNMLEVPKRHHHATEFWFIGAPGEFNPQNGIGRPIVRGSTGETPDPPPAPLDLVPLIATSGSTVTAAEGNSITIPTGYNSLAVYLIDQPLGRAFVRLHTKVGSTTTPIDMFAFSHVIVRAPEGTVVAFGAQYKLKNSNTISDTTEDIVVIPYIMPDELEEPSGVTGTINPDQSSPHLWEISSAHLYLPAQHSCFKVSAATYRRDIFILEYAGGTNLTPTRHVHLPANQAVVIQCRYRFIAIMNITGEAITVTAPSGTAIGNTSTKWSPPFTATDPVNVSTIAEFKAAMNHATQDDIILAPGTYDLSTSGYKVNGANYFNSLYKSLRIRSYTGNPADVVFTGVPWVVSLTSGSVAWTIQDVSWNLDGVSSNFASDSYTGMLNFDGNIRLSNFIYYGANSDSSNDITQISIRATNTTGAITAYMAWGTISKATRDNITCNSISSNAATLHMIGCTVDGCGPNASNNDQLITCHSGAAVACWGVRVANLSNGNAPKIASDGSTSPIYLNYCYARDEDITGSNGLTLSGVSPSVSPSANFLHFCDFPNCKSAYYLQYCVGTRLIHTGAGGAFILGSTTTFIVGSDLYGKGSGATGFERIVDANDTNLTIVGSRITSYSTASNQGCLRLYSTATANTLVGTLRQLTLIAAATGTPAAHFEIACAGGQTPSVTLAALNLICSSSSTYAIGSAITGTSTIGGSFLQKPINLANAPNNWDARFSGTTWASLGSNQRSASDPQLDSYGAPTLGQNVDGTGVDPVILGGLDIYGRPFLGGTFSPGGVERSEIRPSAVLYPAAWI